MSRARHSLLHASALGVFVVAALWLASTPVSSPAAASAPRGRAGLDDVLTTEVGTAQVTLDTSASAVPPEGDLSFAAEVTTKQPLDYLQVRMRLFLPSGDLVYQKTFIEPGRTRGTTSFEFVRTLADIGLAPGTYPVELSVRIAQSDEITETILPASLHVIDPSRTNLPLVLVARVSAQPLTDAEGRFVSDPGQYTRAREDVAKITEYVIENPSARLGLSLSPMMLQEWASIARGYELAGIEGNVTVEASDAVPQAYETTLETLRRALGTGRLELLAAGYSDPDLSELAGAGLLRDVGVQYRGGRSRIESALDATPSTGTAPAGGTVPELALDQLTQSGVGYVVVDRRYVRRKGEIVEPGVYRAADTTMSVLAADHVLERALETSAAAGLRGLAFDAYLRGKTPAPLAAVVGVGPGSLTAERFLASARMLDSETWIDPALAGMTISTGSPTDVRLRSKKPDKSAPADYWRTVSTARGWARALGMSLEPGSDTASQASRASLIAESSVWSGFDGAWAPAGKGLAFAASATRSARTIFDELSLSARRVTLAGPSGRVPVTIVNDTDRVLTAVLGAKPGANLRVGSFSSRVELQPGENLVEIPVTLSNALTSDLEVTLHSAGMNIESTKVSVSASYLDRVAIIVGVVLLLAGILGFIIVRVRTVEDEMAASPDERREPEESAR